MSIIYARFARAHAHCYIRRWVSPIFRWLYTFALHHSVYVYIANCDRRTKEFSCSPGRGASSIEVRPIIEVRTSIEVRWCTQIEVHIGFWDSGSFYLPETLK